MTKHRIHNLTDHSIQCLTCACANIENECARVLLQMTDALSSAGVLAAVFIAGSPEREHIVGAARDAIHEQRTWCRERGPFRRSRCSWTAPHKTL
jgi:hypothetical protein